MAGGGDYTVNQQFRQCSAEQDLCRGLQPVLRTVADGLQALAFSEVLEAYDDLCEVPR